MDATITAGLTFLRAQGWHPLAAEKRWEAYLADCKRCGPGRPPSVESLHRARFALDAALAGFGQTMTSRVQAHVQLGGNILDSRAQRFQRLRNEALGLMSRSPGSDLFAA
jgi:hypothetical protein